MICGKCNSSMVVREELIVDEGYSSGLICKKCGQTGRYGFKNKEESMSKKGVCVNCNRGPMALVAKDLCWTCYTAQRDLTGEERQKALRDVAEKMKDRPVGMPNKPLKRIEPDTAGPGPAFTEAPTEDPKPKASPKETAPKLMIINLYFKDEALYNKVIEEANRNYRTPPQEIMYRLSTMM